MSGPDSADMAKAHVLIADNDAGVSRVLSQVLTRAGFVVELAADGQAALARLRDGGLDLLVCDLDMPRLGGEEVLAALAGIAGAPPAVVISGYLDRSSNRRLLDLPHVRLTLRKPFDVLAFADMVGELCRHGSFSVPPELASRVQVASAGKEAGA